MQNYPYSLENYNSIKPLLKSNRKGKRRCSGWEISEIVFEN